MNSVFDMLIVSFDSESKDESALCVARECEDCGTEVGVLGDFSKSYGHEILRELGKAMALQTQAIVESYVKGGHR